MLNFTSKYLTEIIFLAVTVVLACLLGSEMLLVDLKYDYSFIVFFACLFMLFIPVFYLAMKNS